MITALIQNASDQWLTPDSVLSALGEFDLDPCAHPMHRTRCAKRGYCLPDEDGLLLPWSGRVWLNPPYGRETAKWMERMVLHNNGIMLVKAATETKWFQRAWLHAEAIMFPYQRIQFLDEQLKIPTKDGKRSGSTIPNALLAFGKVNGGALRQAQKLIGGALVWGFIA